MWCADVQTSFEYYRNPEGQYPCHVVTEHQENQQEDAGEKKIVFQCPTEVAF